MLNNMGTKKNMEKDLILFNNNINVTHGKNIAEYEDEKGNYMLLNVMSLFTSVAYEELTDLEYQKAIFDKRVDKNIKFDKKKATRVVDKSTITKNKKDQGTLVDKEVEVYRVWTAINGLGMFKNYNNKEDALKLAKEINKKYLELSDLK